MSAQESMQVKEYNYTAFDLPPDRFFSQELIDLTNASAKKHPEFGLLPFNAQCEDCIELIDRRKEDYRYYIANNSNGTNLFVQQANGPLHYADKDGNWKTLDYRLKKVASGIYHAPDQYIPLEVNTLKGYSSLQLMNGSSLKINQQSSLYLSLPNQFTPALPKSAVINHTAGNDGIIEKNIWPGVDRVQTIGQGEIKTNYLINKPLPINSTNGWWAFEELVTVDNDMQINKEENNGIATPEGYWVGDLIVTDPEGNIWARIKNPVVYDATPDKKELDQNICAFDLKKTDDGYLVRVMVSSAWLNDPRRVFPITVDPLVTGTNTYAAGVMGFESNPGASCWALYCPYNMTVNVPGQSTIISAVFNSQYVSLSSGCSPFQCWMSEASFRISGPCGLSPGPSTYWTCAAPGGNAPGTCTGTGLNMLSTIACTPLSCSNYIFNFEMQNRHCSCTTPSCAITCHNMPVSSWVITIQARTVESAINITGGSSTICVGGSSSLTAVGSWGVPPYTYSWSPGAQTSSTIIVSPATTTTYTCTITDACGNTSTSTRLITVNPLPTLSFNTTNVSCFGGTNGSATVISNTSGPYTIFWGTTPVQTNATANNLAAGTYSVTLTDGNNCTNTASVTINQPATPVTVSVTGVDPTCNGGVNGSATAVPAGGTPGYLFAWNTTPVQTGATATGLTAGTYTVTITDNNNCWVTSTVILNQPTPISLTSSSTSANCNGGTDGTTTVSASGGAGNFTYAWNTVPAQTNATASGLSAGSYTVTVTDQNNCTQTTTVNVTEPNPISISITPTMVLCNGGNTGSASATASGGTGGLSYAWNTVPVQNSAIATGLVAGNYIVTVTDANNCTQTAAVNITEPNLLTLSFSSIDADCNGAATGNATVVPAGGTAGYLYNWNTTPSQSTATASGLSAGSYTVTVTDANNCTQTGSITISEPPQLVVSTSVTNTSCNGGNDGTATAIPSGGSPGYLYTWNTIPAQTSAIATGLSAGNYSVTVTDNNGCVQTASVTVTEPSAIAVSIVGTDPLCNSGNNGNAVASASGGTGIYSYAWNTTPVQTSSTASGLSAGNYTVTVTDANNCTQTASIILNEPSAISLTISSTPTSCNGGNDGSATVGASGGTPGYLYSWNSTPVQSTATALNLSAGSYIVTVTDANGCSQTISTNVNQPTSITLITSFTNVLCNGAATGSATVSASGGTPGYSYAWNTVPAQNSSTASGLIAGNYTVTVTDANNCAQTASVTISEPPAITLTTSSTNATCGGAANGTATVSASGGNGPYSYGWNTTPVQSTATATGLAAGTYTVTVTDNNGCSQTASVTVIQPGTLNLSATTINVLCNGASTGSATVTVSGGTPGYTYSWNTSPVQTTATATGLSANTYTVIVTDANSCSQSLNVTITEPTAISLTTTVNNVTCNGLSNGSTTVSASGGSPGYTYLWNTIPAQTGSTASGLTPGSYTVSVTDNNGCQQTAVVNITEPAALTLTISPTNVSCNGLADGSATANPTGGTSPYTYSWNTSPAQTTQTATGLSGGNYSVTITDNNGCMQTGSVNITEPTALISSTTLVNASCFGLADGSASVTVSGGTPAYTYVWNTVPVQTTATASNLPAGNYSVTTTDNNNCQLITNVTITEPASILLTVNSTNVTCFGLANGIATTIVSGGVAPYSYAWNTSPVQSGATANNLAPGNFTVTVTDANNCTQTASVTIIQPSAITLTTSVVNILCNGGTNGSATVSASGGTPGYNYLWNTVPPQTTITATGLTAGNYLVTVTDQNLCTQTVTATITQPTALVLSTSSTDASCGGIADGTASVSVSGGTPGYIYLWNTTPSQSTSTAVNLVAGTYTVTVTDLNGCTQTSSVIVNQPGNMTVAVTSINVSCFNGNNGSATATPSGGTPPYTYNWNTTPVQNGQTATGLSGGNYTVTVTDFNGCTFAVNVTISQPAAITALTTINNISCNGLADGSAQLTPSGGTPGYTYLWNTVPVQTGQSAIGLSAGNYTVTITDMNSCTGIVNITITEPSALTVSTTSVDVTCFGLLNGQASVSPSGGTNPYTFAWNTVPIQTTPSISGLGAGIFTVSVTDNNGCQQTATVSIVQPTQINLTTSLVHASCNGLMDGSATVSASGGSPGYTYSWNTIPVQNTATATTLGAGNYSVTATDNNGCNQTANVTINQPAPIVLLLTKTDITCNGGTNGTASVSASGGATPYSYAWSTTPVQTTATITGLGQGTYTVTVTDNNGCTQTGNVLIINPPSIVLTVSSTNVSCYGYADAVATVNVLGGASPYTFYWNTLPPQTTQTASNLGPGNFSVTVTDANGCQKTTGVAISQPPPLVTNTSILNVSCFGGNDGSATISVSGGSGPFTYNWSTTPPQSTPSVNNLSAGNYTITITDNNGCNHQVNVTVTQPTDMTVSVSATDVSCFGLQDGQIAASVSGGTPGYNFTWSTNPSQTTSTATDLAPGNYTVTVTDNLGCNKTRSATINQPTQMNGSITSTHVTCFGYADGSLSANANGGVGPYSYNWSNGGSGNTITGLGPGNYSVTITDNSGCTTIINGIITEPPPIVVNSGMDKTIVEGQSVLLDITVVPAGNYVFTWTPPETLDNPDIKSPLASPLANTTYTVTVTDALKGCTGTGQITVTVIPDLTFTLPNAFSPNGDQVNDLFFELGFLELVRLRVFDRWGILVHDSNIPWDGTFDGKPQPIGSYLYHVLVRVPNTDTEITLKGNVTLLR